MRAKKILNNNVVTANNENGQVAMLCFFLGIFLSVAGVVAVRKNWPQLIPEYKREDRDGENVRDTRAYTTLGGQGMCLIGVGCLVLSVPLSIPNPNKMFALCCLICCFAFVGMGITLWIRAKKSLRP